MLELSGVEPNPRIESVRKGVEICKKEKIDRNVTEKVDLPKLHEKNIVRLEVNEMVDLLDMAETGYALSPTQQAFHRHTESRDFAILTLLLGTGIRVSECVGLDVDDIDFNINGFKVIRKGGAQVVLYFSDEVATALKKYLEEHNVQSIKIDDLQYDFLCDSIYTLRKKWLKAHKGKNPERKEYMKPREDLAQLAQATIDKIKDSGKPN